MLLKYYIRTRNMYDQSCIELPVISLFSILESSELRDVLYDESMMIRLNLLIESIKDIYSSLFPALSFVNYDFYSL